MKLAASIPRLQKAIEGHPINDLSLAEVMKRFSQEFPKLKTWDGLRMRALLSGKAFPVLHKRKYFVMLEEDRHLLESRNEEVKVHNRQVRAENKRREQEFLKNVFDR